MYSSGKGQVGVSMKRGSHSTHHAVRFSSFSSRQG